MVRQTWLPVWLAVLLAVGCQARAEDRVLFEKTSPFNTVIVTENARGLRTLAFAHGGACQSVVKPGDPDHLQLPYSRSMPAAMALVERPRRMLIVGLGGAAIPNFLHKHYPDAMIDVVDIDPVVVDVAKRFFGFQEDSRLRAFVKDGRKFIEECREPYDVIFLDAYGADNIPYALATVEFLQAVRRAVSPQGIVVGNVWSRHSNRLYDSMVRTYQEVFPELCILDVPDAGNEILIASPRPARIDRDAFVRQARKLSTEKQFRFDLGDLVTYGFRRQVERNASGQVLRDRRP